jgi:phage terminase small subunit
LTPEQRALGGWAGKRSNRDERARDTGEATRRRSARAEAAAGEGERAVRQPIDLGPEQASIWQELAPHAKALGTLTEASALSFRDLCEVIAVKRAILRTVTAQGWIVASPSGEAKAHPLLVRYQGIYQRVEAGLVRFGLAPMGEEMGYGRTPADPGAPTAEGPPADPFAEFDAPGGVQ